MQPTRLAYLLQGRACQARLWPPTQAEGTLAGSLHVSVFLPPARVQPDITVSSPGKSNVVNSACSRENI